MGSVATSARPPQARPRPTLTTRHAAEGPSGVLELSGEADIATIGMLREELALLGSGRREALLLDLSGLEFCDVASASLLLAARRNLPCCVRGATGPVKRVLDLVDALQLPGPTADGAGARARPSTRWGSKPVEAPLQG